MSVPVPSGNVTSIVVGYVNPTTVLDPVITLVIAGTAYPNGYRINYNAGFRNFFGSYNSSTGNVSVVCQAVAFGENLPAYTLQNVEILVIGQPLYRPAPTSAPLVGITLIRSPDQYINGVWYSYAPTSISIDIYHVSNTASYNIYIASGFYNYGDTTLTLTPYTFLKSVPASYGLEKNKVITVVNSPYVSYQGNSIASVKVCAVGDDGVEYLCTVESVR